MNDVVMIIILGIAVYFAFEIFVWFPAAVVGFFVVAFLSYKKSWTTDKSWFTGKTITVWKWRIVNAIWGNFEDGVTGPVAYNPTQSRLKTFLWYLRNPVRNMGLAEPFAVKLNPAEIKVYSFGGIVDSKTLPIGRFSGYFCSQWEYWGACLNIRIGKTWGVSSRIGWRIFPRDKKGLIADDTRRGIAGSTFVPFTIIR